MKFRKIIILILLIISAFSCEPESKEQSDMEITIGTVCGWCGGTDSLLITGKDMTFTLEAICDRSEYKTSKSIPDSVWKKIIDAYDQNKFSKVNINTCNVCADGCDTWIRVRNGAFTHEIRFGGIQDSSILKPINEFVEILKNQKSKFTN